MVSKLVLTRECSRSCQAFNEAAKRLAQPTSPARITALHQYSVQLRAGTKGEVGYRSCPPARGVITMPQE